MVCIRKPLVGADLGQSEKNFNLCLMPYIPHRLRRLLWKPGAASFSVRTITLSTVPHTVVPISPQEIS